MSGTRIVSLLFLVFALAPMTVSAYSVQLHPDSGGQRIIVGPDGNFWFTRPGGGIGIAGQDGAFLRIIGLPSLSSGTVQDLVVGPDGDIWYSALGAVGHVTTTGNVTEFQTGPPAALNTHPIAITAITTGSDGALWFTETGRNFIGRLTVAGALTVFPIPSSAPVFPPLVTSLPEGITAGPDGALWFTEMQTDKIGRITTAGVIAEYSLPSSGARPVGITTGPDGALWFAESGTGKVGRITTSGDILEFSIPGTPQKSPRQIVAAPDGTLLFTWSTPSEPVIQGGLGRVTTSGRFTIFTTDFVQTTIGLPSDVVVAPDRSIWFIETGALGELADTSNTAPLLVASVLPGGRSGVVGASLTLFATIANAGADMAAGCRPTMLTAIPASLTFAPTDPSTNAITGALNGAVDIPGGSRQSFVLAFSPSDVFPPTQVSIAFQCDNASAAPIVPGVNTAILSASLTPSPDIISIAAPNGGRSSGILSISVPPGAEFLAVATSNVGTAGTITVTADTGSQSLPLALTLCRTDPQTGICTAPMTSSVTFEMAGGSTATFVVEATATGSIPFDPAQHRVFVRFVDASGIIRAVTSVAVQTPRTVFTFSAVLFEPTVQFFETPSPTNGIPGGPPTNEGIPREEFPHRLG